MQRSCWHISIEAPIKFIVPLEIVPECLSRGYVMCHAIYLGPDNLKTFICFTVQKNCLRGGVAEGVVVSTCCLGVVFSAVG